jgi:hypothetical protein
MMNNKSDKQILVDWYFQMLADLSGQDAVVYVDAGHPVEKDNSYLVQERLAYRSNV